MINTVTTRLTLYLTQWVIWNLLTTFVVTTRKKIFWVSMAGHYDGIVGINDEPNKTKIDAKTGKPSQMEPEYRALLSLRNIFPRETNVLNIFGNLEK